MGSLSFIYHFTKFQKVTDEKFPFKKFTKSSLMNK